MKVIAKQDIFISTVAGNCVRLIAGEPREVSQEMGLLALQRGAEQYHEGVHGVAPAVADEREPDNEQPEPDNEEPEPEPEQVIDNEPECADPHIVKIIKELVERGDPRDFTATGKVKAAVIDSWLGRKSTTQERELAWAHFTSAQV